MKAAIYNPYFDTLGGGERYALSFAKVLQNRGYDVYIEWKDGGIKKVLEERFGIDLRGINIVSDIKRGEDYDLCFWVSDGSIPLMHSRQNILHFQVPFHKVNGTSLMNRMKLFRVNKIICNSIFTKSFIDKEFGVESAVVYPPVDTTKIKLKRKENILLYVGRFSKILQSKGQEYLIEAFKKLYDSNFEDWRLVLAGGNEVGAEGFIAELKDSIKNYPIEIVESPDFRTLIDLYGKAKIFWSAAGFGKDEKTNPESMEHFGITVVEAMSAGAVPVVFNGGGYREIVDNYTNGYCWNNLNELVERTKELIMNPKKMRQFGECARDRSKEFSFDSFEKNIVSCIFQK